MRIKYTYLFHFKHGFSPESFTSYDFQSSWHWGNSFDNVFQYITNKYNNHYKLPDHEYRSIDGSGNNEVHTDFGSAGEQFLRSAPSDYGDGINTMAGSDRPSPREISNELFHQDASEPNQEGASNFMWAWGQFIDHDIDLAAEGHTEFEPILVPQGDPYFDPGPNPDVQIIPFSRSGYDSETGENGVPREQINEITAFLDASMVYGSDEDRADYLRGEGGKLKVSSNDLLPYNDADNPFQNAGGLSSELFLAGDVRANENVVLTSLHTLFVNEHNRWVDILSEKYPYYDAETLYQEAKIFVETQIQSITYNDFLPILIGPDALSEYTGYQSDVDPQIANIFATAAYRLGHTMLSTQVHRVDEDGNESEYGHLALQDAFFRPDKLSSEGGIDPILRGLGIDEHETIDLAIISDVRNFLFGSPGEGGLDLGSLNIQRGRDHGLSDYNTARDAYGLAKVTSFSDITSDVEIQQKLSDLYGDVDNIDVFVGGLAEDTLDGSMLGALFQAIIVDQFMRIRDGDSLWYENRLSEDQLEMLEGHWNLSDIIKSNTDIKYLQENVFLAYDRIGGTNKPDNLEGNSGNDLIIGFNGKDTLHGYEGNDELYGGKGRDHLYGGDDDDALFGEKGNDKLYGGSGDDFLDGGKGNDYLRGDGGEDIFYFSKDSGKDKIPDFTPGIDKIDLTAHHLDADTLDDAIHSFANKTIIDFGGNNQIVLQGVQSSDLDENDFIL